MQTPARGAKAFAAAACTHSVARCDTAPVFLCARAIRFFRPRLRFPRGLPLAAPCLQPWARAGPLLVFSAPTAPAAGLSATLLRAPGGIPAPGGGAPSPKKADLGLRLDKLPRVIVLHRVNKLHLDPTKPAVLTDLSLHIAGGEICGLCGPGASGKSVLLKLLCGLITPESGTVQVRGVVLTKALATQVASVQAQIGCLFQNNALFDSLSVFENVAFPLKQAARLADKTPNEAEITERVHETLHGVGLRPHAQKMPSQLSGGQRKRVALARAVVARPPILLYDEPTAGLDPVTTARVLDLLEQEKRLTGATTVMVSSDLLALRRFAPRILMLHKGELLYNGPQKDMDYSENPIVRQFVRGDTEGPL